MDKGIDSERMVWGGLTERVTLESSLEGRQGGRCEGSEGNFLSKDESNYKCQRLAQP